MAEQGTWWVTAHAARAYLKRGFTRLEVIAAAVNPEVTYPGASGYPGQDHREIRQAGRVAVVVDKERMEIVTVLKRGCEWDKEDEQP